MTAERFQKGLNIFFALYWTGLWAFVIWVLFDISYTTGETNTSLYNAAWFGQFGLAFQAMETWGKVVKRG